MAKFFFTTILCSLLHYITFLNLTVGAIYHDKLFPNQTLVIGQSMVSQNKVFEMGFFSPGKSTYRFMGTWYKSTPEVIFGVLNRNNPITASQEAVFTISRYGSLVISSDKSIIWSENPSMVASNPGLQLLDTGNLVLNAIYKPELVFRGERLISIVVPYQSSLLTRISLDTTGTILCHTMNVRKDKWNLAITFPRDTCDEYGSCGPNSICGSDRPIRCQCFRGFVPKIQKDWDLQDWSGGCARINTSNCDGGDGFEVVRGVKYPDMFSFWLNRTMSPVECRDEC